jgi:hypothetical protein
MEVSLDDQIACVDREIRMRRKNYPRLVKRQQLTQKVATLEIERMEAVRKTLLGVRSPPSDVLLFCQRCECPTISIDNGATCAACKLVRF